MVEKDGIRLCGVHNGVLQSLSTIVPFGVWSEWCLCPSDSLIISISITYWCWIDETEGYQNNIDDCQVVVWGKRTRYNMIGLQMHNSVVVSEMGSSTWCYDLSTRFRAQANYLQRSLSGQWVKVGYRS